MLNTHRDNTCGAVFEVCVAEVTQCTDTTDHVCAHARTNSESEMSVHSDHT